MGSDLRLVVVARGGVEPPTFHFSGGRSYQLSYLAALFPRPDRSRDTGQPLFPEATRNSTGTAQGLRYAVAAHGRGVRSRSQDRVPGVSPRSLGVAARGATKRGASSADSAHFSSWKTRERVSSLSTSRRPGCSHSDLAPRAGEVLLGQLRRPCDEDRHPRRPVSRRKRWWPRAARAAFIPAAPCTPPPGWADADPR